MDLGIIINNPMAAAEFFANFVYASPFGIVALFLFTLFANASLFLPILVEPIILAVSALAPNPFAVLMIAIVTGVAAGLGEMSGYIFGLLGVKTLQKMSKKKVDMVFEIGEKLANNGMPIIFMGALTPFPFDLIGIAAGVIKYNPRNFLIAAILGKIVRYGLVGFAGFWGIAWLRGLLGI